MLICFENRRLNTIQFDIHVSVSIKLFIKRPVNSLLKSYYCSFSFKVELYLTQVYIYVTYFISDTTGVCEEYRYRPDADERLLRVSRSLPLTHPHPGLEQHLAAHSCPYATSHTGLCRSSCQLAMSIRVVFYKGNFTSTYNICHLLGTACNVRCFPDWRALQFTLESNTQEQDFVISLYIL